MTSAFVTVAQDGVARGGGVLRLRVAVSASENERILLVATQLCGVVRSAERAVLSSLNDLIEPSSKSSSQKDDKQTVKGGGQLFSEPLLPRDVTVFFSSAPSVLGVDVFGVAALFEWRVALPNMLPPSYTGPALAVEYVACVGLRTSTARGAVSEQIGRFPVRVALSPDGASLRPFAEVAPTWLAGEDAWRTYIGRGTLPRDIGNATLTVREHAAVSRADDSGGTFSACTAVSPEASPLLPSLSHAALSDTCFALCSPGGDARIGTLRMSAPNAEDGLLRPGGLLEIHLVLDPLASTPASAVRVALECTEVLSASGAFGIISRESVVLSVQETCAVTHGDVFVRLAVPVEAPPSFIAAPLLAVSYALRVLVVLSSTAVLDTLFPLEIHPSWHTL